MAYCYKILGLKIFHFWAFYNNGSILLLPFKCIYFLLRNIYRKKTIFILYLASYTDLRSNPKIQRITTSTVAATENVDVSGWSVSSILPARCVGSARGRSHHQPARPVFQTELQTIFRIPEWCSHKTSSLLVSCLP